MRHTSAATPGAPRTPGEEPPMTHNYLIFTDPHRCPRRRRRHPRLVGLAGSDCHRRRLVHRPGSGGRGTLAVAGCPTRHAGRSRLPATSPTESSMRCRRRHPLRPRPTNARARLALRLGAVAVQGGGLPRRINDHPTPGARRRHLHSRSHHITQAATLGTLERFADLPQICMRRVHTNPIFRPTPMDKPPEAAANTARLVSRQCTPGSPRAHNGAHASRTVRPKLMKKIIARRDMPAQDLDR